MKITDKACRAARPGDKLTHDGTYGTGRLLLIVSPAGRKAWVYRDRRGGKDTTKTLGTYPDLGLAEAIIAARRMGSPEPDEPPEAGTLAELLLAYRTSLGTRPSARDARIAFGLAFPKGDPLLLRPARSVTTAEIARVLQRRAKKGRGGKGATTSVNRLRSCLHAAYAFAARYDYDPRRQDEAATFHIETNPVAGTPRVAEWERARSRVLTDDEVKTFMDAARARNDAIGDLWLLMLMTGARLSQLLTAEFGEKVITITDPKGRGGRAKTCVVPVTAAMRPLIFRASLAHCCHQHTVRNAGAAMLPAGATPSDIRRTVETRLQALGVSRDLRGALLSHGNTGVQARHYEQSDLLKQKLTALNRYHRQLEALSDTKPASRRARG